MRNFQQKKGFNRILESSPVLIILAIIFFVFAWKVFGFWGKMRDTAVNREVAEEKILQLKSEEARLKEDIEALNTEEGMEASIREKFGLAKKGEGVIVVVEDKNEEEEKEKEEKGFSSFFKRIFTRD